MTKAMAQRAADELVSKRANTFQPTTTITFSEFVEKYKTMALPNRKMAGRITATSHLKHHLIPWFGELPLSAINQEAVQRMASALLERKMSSTSVRGICGTLKGVFKWAKIWSYPVTSFNRGDLGLPKPPKGKLKFYTLEEAQAIFEAAGLFYGTLFLTQCALALRPGEVLALKVEDFDFKNGTVHIQRNSGPAYGDEEFTTVKSGNDQVLRLSPDLAARLQEFLQATWVPNALGLLFPCPKTRKIINQSNLRSGVLYPLLERLDFPKRGLHAFRHTAASVLGWEGVSPKVVGGSLRHQDGGVLAMTIYTHVLGSDEVTAMDKLGARMCGSPRKPARSELSVAESRTA
jgi:integrase